MSVIKAVLLDVDGTLVDSNDAHASAWVDAFAEDGLNIPFAEIRKKIGMGGDHLLPEVSGIEEDTPRGKKLAERRGEIFRANYLPQLKALPGARELLQRLLEKKFKLVVATSASKKDLDKILAQGNILDLLEDKTSADDAEESKPSPDIILAALKKAGCEPEEAIMLGDTPYDITAATKANVKTIAFLSGGWSVEALGGAIKIYQGPGHLLENLHGSPLFVGR